MLEEETETAIKRRHKDHEHQPPNLVHITPTVSTNFAIHSSFTFHPIPLTSHQTPNNSHHFSIQPPMWPSLSQVHLSNIRQAHCVHAKLLYSCLTLCDPTECSPPGSSVQGILQARITGLGCHALTRDLPNPGLEPTSLGSLVLAGGFLTQPPSIFHPLPHLILQLVPNPSSTPSQCFSVSALLTFGAR